MLVIVALILLAYTASLRTSKDAELLRMQTDVNKRMVALENLRIEPNPSGIERRLANLEMKYGQLSGEDQPRAGWREL